MDYETDISMPIKTATSRKISQIKKTKLWAFFSINEKDRNQCDWITPSCTALHSDWFMGKRAGLKPRAVKYTGIEQKSTPQSV